MGRELDWQTALAPETEGYDAPQRTTERNCVPALRPPAPDDAVLLVVAGQLTGLCLGIGRSPMLIGRDRECDLRLAQRAVSRRHCEVWRDHQRVWVRDLGSTNRTYVNDRPIFIAELKEGDRLAIAETVMELVRRQVPAAPR